MIPKWTPICITWLDAHSDYDNCNSVDIGKSYQKAIRRTIGWLIHQDKERTVVAMDDDRTMNGNNDCQTVTTIPAVMILDLTAYKPIPQPKKTKK